MEWSRLGSRGGGPWKLVVLVLREEERPVWEWLWLVVLVVYALLGTVASIQLIRLQSRTQWTTQKDVHLLTATASWSRCAYALTRSRIPDEMATYCHMAALTVIAAFWSELSSRRRSPRGAALVVVAALVLAEWFFHILRPALDLTLASGFLASSALLAYHGSRAADTVPLVADDFRVMSLILASTSTLRGLSVLLLDPSLAACLAFELVPLASVLFFYRRLPPPNHPHSNPFYDDLDDHDASRPLLDAPPPTKLTPAQTHFFSQHPLLDLEDDSDQTRPPDPDPAAPAPARLRPPPPPPAHEGTPATGPDGSARDAASLYDRLAPDASLVIEI